VETTDRILILNGDLNGQSFSGNVGSLSVADGALKGEAQVKVTRLDLTAAPTLPPVQNVYSSYVIGDVPGRVPTGVWRVQVSAPKFEDTATLNVQRADGLKAQDLNQTITEMFVKDNIGGDISLVGTYLNDAPLDVESFPDRVNEELGGPVDLTYFTYTASKADYDAECKRQGGDVDLGYCSFRNKNVRSQNLQLQSLDLRMISYNVGNVAVSCQAYRYKICYQSTERKVADQILALEQSGKPMVVMLQEMWHGDCSQISTSWWRSWSNPRLCDGATRGRPSVERILGNRYRYSCTQTENIGGTIRNGYECTGIDPWQIDFTNTAYLGDARGYHPECVGGAGVDTGYQVTEVVRFQSGQRFLLVNTHLSGTTDNECRAAQINDLSNSLRSRGNPINLIAGDFNTEPYNDVYAGGVAFRRNFYTPWYPGEAINPVAQLIDSGNMPSARYVWGSPALDHVLSNSFSGNCLFRGYYDGTDHALVDCQLYSGAIN